VLSFRDRRLRPPGYRAAAVYRGPAHLRLTPPPSSEDGRRPSLPLLHKTHVQGDYDTVLESEALSFANMWRVVAAPKEQPGDASS
jgi:hypothetical protein